MLKPGREKSLLRRHPWIFSGAVERVEGNPASGDTLEVVSSKGAFQARAAYSPHSQIRARVWTFDPHEQIDAEFFRRRIRFAIGRRGTANIRKATDALRLIYAELDGLAGLIVDQYADTLVMQCLTTGAELWRDAFADLLSDETQCERIFERSDADVRELEGLAQRAGYLRNPAPNSQSSVSRITVHEYDLKFLVDIRNGHKTGFYLDQRDNRQKVRALAQERDVLDCFCYTGGFAVNALAGGAKSVLAVDASSEALSLAQENVKLNHLPADATKFIAGDVFHVLRQFRDEGRTFDMIVLDPPKFAPTAAQAEKAARGYKDINLLAFKLLRKNGLLVTFSCSGGVEAALFQKIVASAALDAGVDAQILEQLAQAADHPVSLHFPEAAYLKGLICLKMT